MVPSQVFFTKVPYTRCSCYLLSSLKGVLSQIDLPNRFYVLIWFCIIRVWREYSKKRDQFQWNPNKTTIVSQFSFHVPTIHETFPPGSITNYTELSRWPLLLSIEAWRWMNEKRYIMVRWLADHSDPEAKTRPLFTGIVSGHPTHKNQP